MSTTPTEDLRELLQQLKSELSQLKDDLQRQEDANVREEEWSTLDDERRERFRSFLHAQTDAALVAEILLLHKVVEGRCRGTTRALAAAEATAIGCVLRRFVPADVIDDAFALYSEQCEPEDAEEAFEDVTCGDGFGEAAV